MKSIGTYLMIFGAGSFILNLMNYDFRLLMWIDNWGPTIGMAIRFGMVALGLVLLLIGSKQEKEAESADEEIPQSE